MYEYMYNRFNVNKIDIPNIGHLNNLNEKSNIFCSIKLLLGFSLNGGKEYFIK